MGGERTVARRCFGRSGSDGTMCGAIVRLLLLTAVAATAAAAHQLRENVQRSRPVAVLAEPDGDGYERSLAAAAAAAEQQPWLAASAAVARRLASEATARPLQQRSTRRPSKRRPTKPRPKPTNPKRRPSKARKPTKRKPVPTLIVAKARPVHRCGTDTPANATIKAVAQRVAKFRLANSRAQAYVFTVNVYFHVIMQDLTIAGGNVPDAWIAAQLAVINQQAKYGQSTFRFVLAGTDRTLNAAWFTLAKDSATELAMKTALHRGTAVDLNIYTGNFQSGSSGGGTLLGWATFPWSLGTAVALAKDGVCVFFQTLPGGAADYGAGARYNLGMTSVHEVGHWLGLLHTFQGGCSEPNDGVFDTPEMSDAGNFPYTCSSTQDSCPFAFGLDPTSNYLNYSDDVCMNNFTPGQLWNMYYIYFVYRYLPVFNLLG